MSQTIVLPITAMLKSGATCFSGRRLPELVRGIRRGHYCPMGLKVHFDGFWYPDTRGNIEHAVRECIGEPPKYEEWVVSIARPYPFQPCSVQVKTPNQTRSRLFFEDSSALSKAIPDWLNLYPLK